MRPFRLLAASLLLVIAGITAAAAATWDFASPYPADDFRNRSVQGYADLVASASEGALTLVVFADGKLVRHDQIAAALRDNKVPIAVLEVARLGSEPVFAFSQLPLLAGSYTEALQLWNAARPVLQRLLAPRGLMVLYALPGLPSTLISKTPVEAPANLQGVPVAAGDDMLRQLVSGIGGRPVELEGLDLASAFSRGSVRALLAPTSEAVAASAWRFAEHGYDVQASFPLSVVVANQTAFYSLDEASQRALLNAAVEAQNGAWGLSVDQRNAYVELLRAHQLIIQPSPPALQEGLQRAGGTIIRDWENSAGPDGQSILSAYGWSPP
jgi:TRAP-type C4-dicarboxylate transport system substrate-binding protein